MFQPYMLLCALATACPSSGADLASEANKTWLALDRSFTEYVEAESVSIESETNVERADHRLSSLEELTARWDSLKARVLTALQMLEAGQDVDREQLQALLSNAATLLAGARNGG